MNTPVSWISIIALSITLIVAVLSWFAAFIYGIKTVLLRKHGVSLWSRNIQWNPANILLRPELLTDEGRSYRHRFFISLLIFFFSLFVFIIIGECWHILK